MSILKGAIRIDTLELWASHAGPKSRDQWVDGRSAKELARAWLDGAPGAPAEVRAALATHRDFGPFEIRHEEPEAKLPFDSFAGEPRNSDLAVHAEDSAGRFLIAVEGKADEAFGKPLADVLVASLERWPIDA